MFALRAYILPLLQAKNLTLVFYQQPDKNCQESTFYFKNPSPGTILVQTIG